MKKIEVNGVKAIRLTRNEWDNELGFKGGFPHEFIFASGNYVYFKDD